MLDESICHFRGVESILSLILFLMKNHVDRDQITHCVASELGLLSLPAYDLLKVSR